MQLWNSNHNTHRTLHSFKLRNQKNKTKLLVQHFITNTNNQMVNPSTLYILFYMINYILIVYKTTRERWYLLQGQREWWKNGFNVEQLKMEIFNLSLPLQGWKLMFFRRESIQQLFLFWDLMMNHTLNIIVWGPLKNCQSLSFTKTMILSGTSIEFV